MTRKMTVLEAAANACAGVDGCCGCYDDPAKECCMSTQAREVFKAIAGLGGPTLEQCQAIADGNLILAAPVRG